MKELIILVAALSISIISSFIRKKNANRQNTPAPKSEASAWDDILAGYGQEDEPTMAASRPALIDDTELIEAEKVISKRMTEVGGRYNRSRIDLQEVAEELKEPDETSSQDTKANDISRRFNLSDAVIYSEILKPKF